MAKPYQQRVQNIQRTFGRDLMRRPQKASKRFSTDLHDAIMDQHRAMMKQGFKGSGIKRGNVVNRQVNRGGGNQQNQNRVIGGRGARYEAPKGGSIPKQGIDAIGVSQGQYQPTKGGTAGGKPYLSGTPQKGGPSGGKPYLQTNARYLAAIAALGKKPRYRKR